MCGMRGNKTHVLLLRSLRRTMAASSDARWGRDAHEGCVGGQGFRAKILTCLSWWGTEPPSCSGSGSMDL